MRLQHHPHRLSAISLIELLVSIAVIALLASLLTPIFRGTTDKSRQTQSVARLRSIGLATRVFANEHNGKIPQFNYPAQMTFGRSANRYSPIRALFPRDSILGGHPLGGGDYLQSVEHVYSPFFSKFRENLSSNDYYSDASGQWIGYYLHSLPKKPSGGQTPVTWNGQLITNDTIYDWGKSPLYSDYLEPLSTTEGYEGPILGVLHLDGSVSMRIRKAVEEVRSTRGAAAFYYYLSVGNL